MRWGFNMIDEVRCNVVGDGEVVLERIKEVYDYKRVSRQTLDRVIIKTIKLSCGHEIDTRFFKKIPTKNTRCYECEEGIPRIRELKYDFMRGKNEWVMVK